MDTGKRGIRFNIGTTEAPSPTGPIYETQDDSTNESVQQAAELFFYLNLCPNFMFEWTDFYIRLLKNAQPDIIVQTLNRIIETGRVKKENIVVAKKMFAKIRTTLALTNHKINVISNGGKQLDMVNGYNDISLNIGNIIHVTVI